jgi:hypothetical protein
VSEERFAEICRKVETGDFDHRHEAESLLEELIPYAKQLQAELKLYKPQISIAIGTTGVPVANKEGL